MVPLKPVRHALRCLRSLIVTICWHQKLLYVVLCNDLFSGVLQSVRGEGWLSGRKSTLCTWIILRDRISQKRIVSYFREIRNRTRLCINPFQSSYCTLSWWRRRKGFMEDSLKLTIMARIRTLSKLLYLNDATQLCMSPQNGC